MDELRRLFAENLKRQRRRTGLYQEELSFLAEIHRTEIGMLERGARLPRLDTIVKLAGGLELEPGELLDGMSWCPGSPRRGSFRELPMTPVRSGAKR
jgi:transcriptional regulator with XRE-family HTH domain